MKIIAWIFGILILIGLAAYLWPLLLLAVIIVLAYKIYEMVYFNGEKFQAIKSRIQNHIQDCNELNQHIEI